MSPVFILSRLCLKRRFQFFGISVPPEVRYLTTFLTASSSITLRRPTQLGVLRRDVHGHVVVQDLDRQVLALLAENFRFSRFTTVPAPWCGYTTLSPTLYKLRSLFPSVVAKVPAALEGSTGEERQGSRICRKTATFAGLLTENPCSEPRFSPSAAASAAPQRVGLERRALRAGRREHRSQTELAALLDPPLGLRGRAADARSGRSRRTPRGPRATGTPLRRRGDRERDPQVGAGLVDAHAARDVDEDVGAAERQARRGARAPRRSSRGASDRRPCRRAGASRGRWARRATGSRAAAAAFPRARTRRRRPPRRLGAAEHLRRVGDADEARRPSSRRCRARWSSRSGS